MSTVADAPDLERRFGGLARLYGAQGAVRIRQAHVAVVAFHATREAVGDNAGLLKNLLEHKVAVAALLRGLHVPLNGLRLGLHRTQILEAHNGKI